MIHKDDILVYRANNRKTKGQLMLALEDEDLYPFVMLFGRINPFIHHKGSGQG